MNFFKKIFKKKVKSQEDYYLASQWTLMGRKLAKSRIAPMVPASPIQWVAKKGAEINSPREMIPLHKMLYRKQPDNTQLTFCACLRPSSSAVKYIVAVRTPAIPAVLSLGKSVT